MEKERKIKTLSLVALIVAVLGLTVAFAALSQTLTINGTASVNSAEWDVHIIDLTRTRVEGSAKVLSEPTISSDGKSIENLNVSLNKPGDEVRYDFKFTNTGTIDAVLTKEFINGLDYDINEEEATEEEQELIKEALRNQFPKADWDGDGITTDEERIKARENISFYTDHYSIKTLDAGQSMFCHVQVQYNLDSTELPKGEVVINFRDEYVFSQK